MDSEQPTGGMVELKRHKQRSHLCVIGGCAGILSGTVTAPEGSVTAPNIDLPQAPTQ